MSETNKVVHCANCNKPRRKMAMGVYDVANDKYFCDEKCQKGCYEIDDSDESCQNCCGAGYFGLDSECRVCQGTGKK